MLGGIGVALSAHPTLEMEPISQIVSRVSVLLDHGFTPRALFRRCATFRQGFSE